MLGDERNNSKTVDEPDIAGAGSTHDADESSEKAQVATFKMLCQSSDGKLCLFEDAQGHFTAVRTDRLA